MTTDSELSALWRFCPFDGTRLEIVEGAETRYEVLRCEQGDEWVGDVKYPSLDLTRGADGCVP